MLNLLAPFEALARQFWWMAIPVIGLQLLKLPTVKGWIGEMLLHTVMRIMLVPQRYHLLHDVTLPTADGSTQIDHIVVSPHGVFVIETKNYGGWIFGKVHDRKWTQKFGRRSHQFQNPLRQNYKHVRTLAELTGLDGDTVFSVIAFVGSARLKTPMPDNVTGVLGCVAHIRSKTAVLLDDREVAAILSRIASRRLVPSRRTSAAHKRHVQELVAARQVAATAERPLPAAKAPPAPARASCPHCAAAVNDYTFTTGARAGQSFRGCVRFPACGYRSEAAA